MAILPPPSSLFGVEVTKYSNKMRQVKGDFPAPDIAGFSLCQYSLKPRNFDTADIKSFTVGEYQKSCVLVVLTTPYILRPGKGWSYMKEKLTCYFPFDIISKSKPLYEKANYVR